MIFTIISIVLLQIFSPIYAGDFPIAGVVLLTPQPPFPVTGSVTITQKEEGGSLFVEGSIVGVLPNRFFGLHVHEHGDITKGCASVGAHFNPYGKKHGSEKASERHWGDFGNVMSDMFGHIRVSLTIPQGSLIGTDGFIGRTLVLHVEEDDLGLGGDDESQKTGNAGPRLACGVIGIRQPADLLPVPQRTQWTTKSQRSSQEKLSFQP